MKKFQTMGELIAYMVGTNAPKKLKCGNRKYESRRKNSTKRHKTHSTHTWCMRFSFFIGEWVSQKVVFIQNKNAVKPHFSKIYKNI